MKHYTYDTHVHTSEISPCAKVEAATVVKMYKEAGYTGIVITDHFYNGYLDSIQGSWNNKIDSFLKGYMNARNHGEKIGLKVLLGIELRFTENSNDYLVYGIDEAFLKHYENFHKWGLKRFFDEIKSTQAMIYQAHPYRQGVSPANPKCLNGIEVHNGNPRYDSRNDKAKEFAIQNNLKEISGSDFHRTEDLALGGIILSEAPADSFELTELLRTDRVLKLITE